MVSGYYVNSESPWKNSVESNQLHTALDRKHC